MFYGFPIIFIIYYQYSQKFFELISVLTSRQIKLNIEWPVESEVRGRM